MYKTRREAKEAGSSHYFTGMACKNGHVAARSTSNSTCVECHRELYASYKERVLDGRRKQMTEADREAERERSRKYVRKNRDALKVRRRAKYHSNIELSRKVARERYLANPAPFKANAKKRKHQRRKASPSWFSDFDTFVLEQAFSLCSLREKVTGIEWHVDHMIPLRARNACGLHCASNIQVIPAVLNMAKHNKMVLTKVGEWIYATPIDILGRQMSGSASPLLCKETGRVFDGAGDAVAWLRLNGWPRATKTPLTKCLAGEYKKAYGYSWQQANEKSPE